MNIKILRLPDVCKAMGLARSTVYLRVSQGLLTKPISLGGKAVGWPYEEVEGIILARIYGKSNKEISLLVQRLTGSRKNLDKKGGSDELAR